MNAINRLVLGMKIFFIYLFSIVALYPQASVEKWGKKQNPYLVNTEYQKRDYSINENNIFAASAKIVAIGYWFFISDLDGDNCPFSPSCSSFLMQSLKQTNIFKASLMFGDRFMRDANIFGRDEHYPYILHKHYYDPPSLYLLDRNEITKFINSPPAERR